MTMERILLQTIKFDLMIEHPYSNLLKFAKFLKGNIYIDRVYKVLPKTQPVHL